MSSPRAAPQAQGRSGRKKKPPEHVDHERWLISYADFITLLFAFFVVMFAVSQVDSKRLGRFTQAFSRALGLTVVPLAGASMFAGGQVPDDSVKGPGTQPSVEEIEKLRDDLNKMIETTEALRGMQLIERRHELVLRLPEAVLFDTGAAQVKSASLSTLTVLTRELAPRKLDVRIEGHTDNRPMSTGRYRTNWELSTARSSAVLIVMVAAGLPKEHVSVAGYSEHRPVASNDTDEGRKQNRRVDIVVTTSEPLEPESSEVSPAAPAEP